MNINSPLCGLALPEKTERDNRKECQRLCRWQSEPNSVHTGKKWDDKKGCWKDKPLHDHTSHGADGFRYFAVAMGKKDRKPQQQRIGFI